MKNTFVCKMVASEVHDPVWGLGMRDRAARGVDAETRRVQGNGDALADSPAGSGDERHSRMVFPVHGATLEHVPARRKRREPRVAGRQVRSGSAAREGGLQAPWIRLQTQPAEDPM